MLFIDDSLPAKPENSIALVAGPVEIYIPLPAWWIWKRSATGCQKELAETQAQIDRLEKLLGSDFANKAPAAVVQKERETAGGFQETAEKSRHSSRRCRPRPVTKASQFQDIRHLTPNRR